MALPKRLKDFQLFENGESWDGEVKSVELPELGRNLTAYRGAGMAGPVQVDMGQNEIQFQWTQGGFSKRSFRTYGAPTHDAEQLRFEGSAEDDDTGEVVEVRIIAHGRNATLGSSSVAGGEDNDGQQNTMTCSYYKLEVGGEDIIEIDMVGGDFKVFGEDRYAERRRAIGKA